MSAAPVRQRSHRSAREPRRGAPRRLGWLAAVVLLITSLGSGALGQTPLDAPEARMELVEQPVWYEPGDDLGIRVEVFNLGEQPLEGFRIIVGVDDLIRTRSELDLFFEGVPRFEPSRIPIDLDTPIEPGGSQVVSIDEPLDAIPTLGAAREAGVYPASLTLQDAEGIVDMDTVATPFIFYPEEPEKPLGLVLAVPLNAAPSAAPDGSYDNASDEGALDSMLDPAAGLRAVIDALHEATGAGRVQPAGERSSRRRDGPPDPLHVAVAPTPRLLSEISDLASGERSEDERAAEDEDITALASEFIELLTEIVKTEPAVEPILVPYSFPDLPSLVASDLPIEHLAQQLSASRDVLATTLGLDLDGEWLYPPGGRLDAVTLERLQLLGFAKHSFFSHTSLDPLPQPSGCPSLSPTFTCPIEVEISEGVSTGFVSDPGLVERASGLQGDPLDRVAIQKVLAETAMIHVELPGTTGRIIQLTIPASWNPSDDAARHLLLGLRDAPWLTSMTPSQALAEAEELISRTVDAAATLPGDAPPEDFFEELQRSSTVIDSYASILPAGNERIARLRRNLLVATSRNLWGDLDVAASYLRESRTEAEEAMEHISIELAQDFTLTSREGQVQLRVTNDTEDPVRLNIVFLSDGLAFEENETTQIFEPGSHLLELKTVARGSGVFRLDTRVETPEGGYLIDEKHTVIRSTSFNQIALTITIGALVFLVLFYLVRATRRRGHKKAVEA